VTFPHLSCRILGDLVAGIIDLGIPSLWVNVYEEVIKQYSLSLFTRVFVVADLSLIYIGLGTVTFRWVMGLETSNKLVVR
jgi:hypothetical protein